MSWRTWRVVFWRRRALDRPYTKWNFHVACVCLYSSSLFACKPMVAIELLVLVTNEKKCNQHHTMCGVWKQWWTLMKCNKKQLAQVIQWSCSWVGLGLRWGVLQFNHEEAELCHLESTKPTPKDCSCVKRKEKLFSSQPFEVICFGSLASGFCKNTLTQKRKHSITLQ